MTITPFDPPYSAEDVADLRQRLAQTRWIGQIDGAGWDYGVERGFLEDLCRYWQTGFDWQVELERVRRWQHFRFENPAADIHFVHVRGQGPRPLPILLCHGWPSSFLELLELAKRLAEPAAFGADAADAFDVVVPSLPGFGYSAPPRSPGMNMVAIAALFTELMAELGYPRFAAQGGDFGAGVCTALGLAHAERIVGLHFNFVSPSYKPVTPDGTAKSDAELAYFAKVARWSEDCGAYSHVQRTRPQTLSYALNDSPAGLAAWIVEKYREWSDCQGDVYRRFTRDELLTNITLYWMTGSIASANRLYRETRQAPLVFGPGDFVRSPCAFAHFPAEVAFPPRSWVERGFNVARWTDMPRGGHFAAFEEPELMAADLRDFFRPLRT